MKDRDDLAEREGGAEARVGLLILGRVQGVFYRACAMETAQRLGLTGWVRNLPDGGVEALAEGKREALEEFVAWCEAGPPAARVDKVEARWLEPTGELSTFRVVW